MESAQAPSLRRPAFIFIFITVLLDILAIGLIVPMLPKLVVDLNGAGYADGTRIYGVFATVGALMTFLFSPVLGSLSDRFGRRPVILLSNFGLGLDYIVMALAPNLAWLFVGRVVSGITSASFTTAGAYIADVTPPEKRAAKFGMLGVAFGIGFVFGPFVGGELGHYSPRLPFWVAAGLSLANAAYGMFVLPESLPHERRAALSWQRANPVGALTMLREHRGLFGLASIKFLLDLAHVSLPVMFVLYANHRYGWSERDTGRTLALVGVCAMIVQGGLVGPAVKKLGEMRALIVGTVFGAAGFAIYGLATKGWIFLLGIPVMSLWGFAGASVQSLATKRVAPTEQGRLQGALSALTGIAMLLGPTLFTTVFAMSIAEGPGQLPGATYYVAALMLLIALAIALTVRREVPALATQT